jgi:hypothetical protein
MKVGDRRSGSTVREADRSNGRIGNAYDNLTTHENAIE